ncbi:MAG: lipocalin family protein [Desulfobulbaceae bacterium]|nr:lipocalin family protein [Desulfobulbaceae bacterium]
MINKPIPPVRTVYQVDISRYIGTWFEIARYPNRFQKGCVASRATYALRADGNLSVLNECYDKSKSGKLRSARGKAWVVDPLSRAKLKVSFFWPFYGDYWIIDLGQEYEYAVIGHPQRKYLWILSREETMEEETYQAILSRLAEQHYDTTKIIKSGQGE